MDGIGDMLGNLVNVCLRATTNEGGGSSSRDAGPLPAVVSRTLLLLRNLALAPSTGQVCTEHNPFGSPRKPTLAVTQ